ncbi:hypothetical protein J4E90_006326 [Alternaria incomplexa]|uniref:uncharacterized protein n=1 Tax=Alternaria incomplexa TaxID=1187928 RepID=UPI00221F573C|nr:uncharacterized protein J4E90_006326 [Alternaria incomplexa]KAI4912918.1 hypothetical protein J4E90_006326 [Alternaria incomplexa]
MAILIFDYLKALARARYTSDFESGSVFDIIHTTVKHGNSTSYDTHLIVYESPSTNEVFQFLITMQCNSFAQGLEALMSRIQAQLGRSISRLLSQ